MASPTLSIVAPAYNEERNLPAFLAAMIPVMESIGETFEIIFIDDGSRDGTLGMLAAAASQDPRIKVIGLARNFGKDIALSAGLAHATGRAVIPIDCDLQHPPELIPEFVAKWRAGYDMVLGVRSKRDEEGFVRRNLSRTYYKVMRAMTSVEIPPNAGDFRLLDRKILDVINKMPERHRFMKGIFAWPGFKVTSIEFQARARANDTQTTWSFFKLWRFALDGLFSFSTAPLKLWTYIGALSAGGAFLYLLITVIQKLFFGITVPGYASLLIVLLFFNGLLLISNGIQGEYIARIFEEVKGRPLYVVGQTFGFDPAGLAASRSSIPVAMPAAITTQHAAPPPTNPSATQIGLATGPQPLPTYLPPAPIPPSSPHVIGPPPAQPARPSSPTQPPMAAQQPRPSSPTQPPPTAAAAPPRRTNPPTHPPRRSPTMPPPRTSSPTVFPIALEPAPATPMIVEPPRVRAPSSPPIEVAKRAPTAPPIAAPIAVPAQPSSPHLAAPVAVPTQPSSPHLGTPVESASADTVPTTTETPGERRPRHELPKPKGPTLPR